MSFAIVIVLFGIVYLVINFLQERRELQKVATHFGGPKPLPIVGNLLEFNTDIPGIFEKGIHVIKTYGPNVFIWGPMNHNALIIGETRLVERVLNAKHTQKSVLYSFLDAWLRTGLLLSKGEKWFQRRRIITPTFHFKILEQFVSIFNREADIMVKNLRRHVDGGEFDIYSYVTLMALDSVCATSMGTTVNAQNDPENNYVQNVKRMSVLFLLRVFDVLGKFPTLYSLVHPRAYEQRRVIKELHAFTDNVITTRRKQLQEETDSKQALLDMNQNEENIYSKQKHSFLDLLLRVNVDGKPLSDLDIREEVDTFMFEGHDTTTSGISFTIYQLALNLPVQERIFEEIIAVLGKDYHNADLDYHVLQQFKYLEMVIKEGLRLFPSVPFIGRNLTEPIELDGITLPAGQDVLIPIYTIHRNPKVFPDPERFDPERFADDGGGVEASKRGPYDYIPFSAGTRNCIGQKYAMLVMKSTLIKLVANYRVLAGESLGKLRVKTDLVIRPDVGIPIKLVERI